MNNRTISAMCIAGTAMVAWSAWYTNGTHGLAVAALVTGGWLLFMATFALLVRWGR